MSNTLMATIVMNCCSYIVSIRFAHGHDGIIPWMDFPYKTYNGSMGACGALDPSSILGRGLFPFFTSDWSS